MVLVGSTKESFVTTRVRLGRCVRAAVVVAAVMVSSRSALRAQTDSTAAQSGPVALSKVLDGMLSGFEKELMGAANAMPAERYSFAPSQAIFVPSQKTTFDGVRTFAQQCTHIAAANYFIYSQVSGTKPSVDVKSLKDLKTKDEVIQALAASFVFAHQAIATISPDNALDPVQGDRPMTRATMATYGVAHGFDHYGQMVEYLRMNGIVPPASQK